MCSVARIVLVLGRHSNSVASSSFEGFKFVMVSLFLLNRVFMNACLRAAGVVFRRFLIMFVFKYVPRRTVHLRSAEVWLK